jgi:hypothetical protein
MTGDSVEYWTFVRSSAFMRPAMSWSSGLAILLTPDGLRLSNARPIVAMIAALKA